MADNVHALPTPRRGLVAAFIDGYQNLVSRLGTSADRNVHAAYWVPILSQPQLEAAHRSSWLTRKCHDLIPYEMTRAQRDWQAEAGEIEKLEEVETLLGVWQKLFMALVTARLHGGSAMLLGVLGAGSPNQQLNPERVALGGLRYLHVVSRHQLQAPFGFDENPASEFFGGPSMWRLQGTKGNYVDIHPSRVIPFHGQPIAPGAVSVSRLDQFWGDPLLFSIKAAIDNAEGSQASVATLLHELKRDVIKIPGLTELIATGAQEDAVAARLGALTTFASMFNALLLDAGDGEGKGGEEWETRQLNLSQMPELLDAFIGIVAGATDIPKTRLMGASPGGLQSTGKGEQDDFNRMIAARQSFELKPILARLDAVLIPSALGSRPPEIYYEFAPLEEADPKAAAEIEKLEIESVEIATRTNHLPPEAIAKAFANRLKESGRWPGLEITDQELDAHAAEELERKEESARMAANENAIQEAERRGTVTRDQAMTLLTDARPRTLYVRRNLLNGAEFIKWAKTQGFETTTPADELHVTIAFSRQPVDWIKAGGESWTGDDKGELTVAPGGPRLVERLGDKGAVVLLFASSALSWRHEEIKRAGASFDFDEYQPHITITYQAPEGLDLRNVEPFRGKLEFGPEIFEEVVEGWEQTIREG